MKFWHLHLVAVLLLGACGKQAKDKTDPSPVEPRDETALFAECGEPSATSLEALEMRYQPASQKLLVSAFVLGSENAYVRDFFYFTGTLANGASLTEPTGEKDDLLLTCQDSSCRNFSFRLKSDLTKTDETVKARRFASTKLAFKSLLDLDMTPATARDPQGRDIGPSRSSEQEWRYILERMNGPEKASVLTSCQGGKIFFNVYIESQEVSSLGPSWYTVSGKLGDKKFAVSTLQNLDGRGPVESIFGAMEFDISVSNQELRIGSPSSELLIKLDMKSENLSPTSL